MNWISHFGFCETTLISSSTVFAINAPTSEKPTTLLFFFSFFWEVRSHEWNENQASLMSRTGAGSLPEVLFQNTGLKFSLLSGEGEREFWNTENLWGLSLAQTPHYTPLEAKWHESPGGQGDPGEELLESRCVERKRKERMKNNIFHLWY